LGPEVIRAGDHYADALEVSEQRIHDTGALRLHAYDDVDVAAGQGTCAAELSEQAPELDTVFVAVGGGGLIAGFAAWYEGDVAVIGVEPERCPALYSARAAGCPVDVDVSGVAVDSLGARRLGDVPWGVNPWIADALLVSDAQIIRARRWLWNELRLVSEHGGAAALAPLLSGAYVPAENERVGVILCGSNTTFDL
jgi:threonine dehydratase